ncbi:hypothetical protein GCK32_004133 [Trichostrongylus colubriformis]|uniref:TIL domain-containing protein n=1 Tax=Trichostrongylus colubriformis TaxID=6319 RepID=A0AAN8G1N5_TRICO
MIGERSRMEVFQGFCSLRCVATCQCKSGFLKNENGACVANCTDNISKPACAPNEVFMECGSACEPHCRDPRPQVCSLECVPGCQCKSGFFRNDRNECVKECDNASSNICPENEEFKQCGTACEPSCKNPKPLVCTLQCLVNVCQCKHGFFRNSNNKCVSDCGKDTCGINEELTMCGTACEPTCDEPIRTCTKQCVPNVCQCKQGFIRDANHTCISQKDCPPALLNNTRNSIM